MSPLSRISVSLSPVELVHSSLAYFKAKRSWGSSFQCQTCRLGSLHSELSLLWEILSNIIILQFVDHPLGKYGIWTISQKYPYHLWLLWGGMSLLVGLNLSLSVVVQQPVVTLVLS